MRTKQYALLGAPKQDKKGVLSYAGVLKLLALKRMGKKLLKHGLITKEQYIKAIDKCYWALVKRSRDRI